MTTHEVWQAALGELELSISKPNFTAWFRHTFISEISSGECVICVPNTFTLAWLEKKYQTAILKAIQNVTGSPIRRITYRVETRSPAALRQAQTNAGEAGLAGNTRVATATGVATKPAASAVRESPPGGLNPKYIFENFVVGKGNELAHAAAQAVSQRPGTAYNPLFIYGGVGLGKTHLLQAIGHDVLHTNPHIRVLYVSSEKFISDFILAVRSGRGKEFKDTYRNIDLLLIDDIQFITGKESTQDEFFHTFNALHQANKQIALTSDRPPKAIPALEQRLLSRFEWGMIADIASPDLETRAAILDSKCRSQGFELPREIILHLAHAIQSNVRELEGALTKIVAYHRFKNLEPTLETVTPILAGLGRGGGRTSVTPRELIKVAAEYYDLEIEELLGKSREKRLAYPRQIIMYIMREEMRCSYPAIGQEIGGRDHTTAMHAYCKISKGLEQDEKLQQDVETLRQRVFMK